MCGDAVSAGTTILVACPALWREGLLAQKVLGGNTRGYLNHPQLERFRAHPYPLGANGAYLPTVSEEARLMGTGSAEAGFRYRSMSGNERIVLTFRLLARLVRFSANPFSSL